MEASSKQAVAHNLRLATRNGAPISTTEAKALDLELAAEIAAIGRELAVAEGERVIGYKIGLTAAAVRDSFKTDSPVQGYLLESTLAQAGGVIDTSSMTNPAVEAEVAFIIGKELKNPQATIDEVIEATQAVAPAIEIVDSRWHGGPSSLAMLIADNTNAAAAVVGEPVALPNDIAEAKSLLIVGSSRHPGTTETVLGNPLESVAWLARHLAQSGSSLKPGDIILSGSMNVPAPLGDAKSATSQITGLGSVSTNFS